MGLCPVEQNQQALLEGERQQPAGIIHRAARKCPARISIPGFGKGRNRSNAGPVQGIDRRVRQMPNQMLVSHQFIEELLYRQNRDAVIFNQIQQMVIATDDEICLPIQRAG